MNVAFHHSKGQHWNSIESYCDYLQMSSPHYSIVRWRPAAMDSARVLAGTSVHCQYTDWELIEMLLTACNTKSTWMAGRSQQKHQRENKQTSKSVGLTEAERCARSAVNYCCLFCFIVEVTTTSVQSVGYFDIGQWQSICHSFFNYQTWWLRDRQHVSWRNTGRALAVDDNKTWQVGPYIPPETTATDWLNQLPVQ